MNEKPIYLKALNIHCFRVNEENPKVIGFVNYTPRNLTERACFKVLYESDNTVDFIPYVELENGNWMII